MRKTVALVAFVTMCTWQVGTGIAVTLTTAPKTSWASFWRTVKVDPPPPSDFLDGTTFRGKILNLTDGRLSDAVVKQWIEADLRRGEGDAFATYNLRRDIADAGIFGPSGLNGTSEMVDREIAQGVSHIEGKGYSVPVAAAVIWLSKEEQRANSSAGYTEYVIVHVRRMTGRQRMRIYKDGKREPFGKPRQSGELVWQLDTGHFFTHPVLGPLWYQKTGWACDPNAGTQMGEICARVKP